MYCQAAMGLYEKQNKIRTMIPKKSHLPKVTPTWVEQTITYILNNSRDALHSELVKMFYLLLNSPVIFRLPPTAVGEKTRRTQNQNLRVFCTFDI